LLAQRDHVAEHRDDRRLQAPALALVGEFLQGADGGLLPSGGTPTNRGRPSLGIHPLGNQFLGDCPQAFCPHENHLRARRLSNQRPVHRRPLLRRVLVTGHYGKDRRAAAVRQRDAGVAQRGSHRRHPGNHLEGNPSSGEFLRLLSAASEDVRISALETHHTLADFGSRDEQLRQFGLREAPTIGRVESADLLSSLGREPEQVLVGQRIVDHHVRAAEQFSTAKGDQLRVARASANQINGPN